MSSPDGAPFDPVALLRELERGRVAYVLVGTLAGILRGAPEVTSIVEICPALKDENLLRLEQTLVRIGAVPGDRSRGGLRELAPGEQRRFDTPDGELVIEPVPAGTRGYDELRRQAERERLDDRGLLVSVASLGDLLRTLRARDLPDEVPRVRMYRRLNELTMEHERSFGVEL